MQLLENISYQKTYFGLKILLSDFEDYQEKNGYFQCQKNILLSKMDKPETSLSFFTRKQIL